MNLDNRDVRYELFSSTREVRWRRFCIKTLSRTTSRHPKVVIVNKFGACLVWKALSCHIVRRTLRYELSFNLISLYTVDSNMSISILQFKYQSNIDKTINRLFKLLRKYFHIF